MTQRPDDSKNLSIAFDDCELSGLVGDLTAFQRDLLVAIAHVQADPAVEPSGQAAKAVAESLRDEEVLRGRLYPNLDDLIAAGLVTKGQIDRRTNAYRLTDRGERALVEQWEVLSGAVNALDRADATDDTDDDGDEPDGIDYATAEDAVDANRTLQEAADDLGVEPGRARAILLHHDLYAEVQEAVPDGGEEIVGEVICFGCGQPIGRGDRVEHLGQDYHRRCAPDVATDGGEVTVSTPIRVGDVCLDLAQGRPVHVLEDTGQTAAAWSEANDYELTENYGNSRLGATDHDRVYEVVYCSSATSEPSKTYAMPASRLLRVETEAADDGRPAYERVARDVLEDLFGLAMALDEEWEAEPDDFEDAVTKLVANSDHIDRDLVDEARELAAVERTIGGDPDE